MLVYAVQRTDRSHPVAHFSSYRLANEYNHKYFDGKYRVCEVFVYVDVGQ